MVGKSIDVGVCLGVVGSICLTIRPTSEITGPGRKRHGKHYEHRPRLRCIDLLGGCAISAGDAMSAILPCPFCGKSDMGNGGIQHKADCWIVLKFFHNNVADPVMLDAWNRRENPPNARDHWAGPSDQGKADQTIVAGSGASSCWAECKEKQ